MKLTELQKEIFEINKANGWHDKFVTRLEQHELFRTEIDEVYEACQNEEELVWYDRDGKPEGIAIELADIAIRILDYFSLSGYDVEQFDLVEIDSKITEMSIFEFLAFLHSNISLTTEYVRNGYTELMEIDKLFSVIAHIDHFLCVEYSLKLTDLITEKIAYNQTRGYRYGGKVI